MICLLSIIIAFPKIEDAKTIKNILIRNGYEPDCMCTSGAQAVSLANEKDGGILLCGYHLPDMHYSEIHRYLPREFDMILITSPKHFPEYTIENLICLGMPLKAGDLINTLQMMTCRYQKKRKREKQTIKIPAKRSEDEIRQMNKAKLLLMERNHLTEDEAHRFLQKMCMENGVKLSDMAQAILDRND